ncbi:IclR family transcriptional regulator [Paraglaciecola sp. MB-3u-78]|jgi:IclR family acetate operon transcriptional repressor|uniref:IclR family transcriptional regulator n=1 Tax=Paraglaciecola sp. MB-3u-78 TaxID=2058332 RepID=UPI000C33B8FE|nr:IclR family transcriptional regulator [Paraglaciecola sp. MB-3u-78]PKG98466.1 IclR family transcriptional regulator [Paraglaciecola sp. MB-3u-78]
MQSSLREKGSAVARVMQIIEAVSKAERPLSPADLAIFLHIPKPSIHRLVNQLEEDGFLQTTLRGLIIPGVRMHSVAWGVLHSERFSVARRAILEQLTEQIGETCGIAIPKGTEMVYYDRVQSDWPLQLNLQVGSHTPTWCTASGKLYLSSLPKQRRQKIISHLPLRQYARNTIVDAQALEAELAAIKMRKISTDNEEFVDGMVGCGVPILDSDNKLCACLFSHAPVLRKSLDQLIGYSDILRAAAAELGSLIDGPDSATR